MSTTITIQGNVTREPEIRVTPDGRSMCNLSVAVNRKVPSKKTGGFIESVSYFDVVAFDDLATNACETLGKGSRVVVTGRLDQRAWETASGEKRTKYELVAADIGASLRWVSGQLKRSNHTATVPVITAPPLPLRIAAAAEDHALVSELAVS